MMDFNLVFWGYSLGDLLLAAGRYTLVISATLLVAKHVVWFARRRHRHANSWRRVARSVIELAVAGNLAVLYWRHIWLTGADTVLGEIETLAVVWSMAALFLGLLLSRQEGMDDQ